jgi:hypothetical protein
MWLMSVSTLISVYVYSSIISGVYIANSSYFNDRIIYTFHIQCIIKVEDLNALYLEN